MTGESPAASNPVIEHFRDVITAEDGSIDQVYSYLVYDFGGGVIARAYLDDPMRMALMQQGSAAEDVLDDLKARFRQIDRLGRQGYETIWAA